LATSSILLLGGAPLAMAYKAVNTLDSMVGYKHEKYRAIAPARPQRPGAIFPTYHGGEAKQQPAQPGGKEVGPSPPWYVGKMAPGRCGRAGAIAISTAVLTAPGRKR
jgi:hypothetical protein